MRSNRKDRYASPLNAKSLARWLFMRPDYLIKKLHIENQARFHAWLAELEECIDRRKSGNFLSEKIHQELPPFIGDESAWPSVKSNFRKWMHDNGGHKVTIQDHVFNELRCYQERLGSGSINEALEYLTGNLGVIAGNQKSVKIFKAFTSTPVQDYVCRFYAKRPLTKAQKEKLGPDVERILRQVAVLCIEASESKYATLNDAEGLTKSEYTKSVLQKLECNEHAARPALSVSSFDHKFNMVFNINVELVTDKGGSLKVDVSAI